ncbi:hypothetical protein [Eubacterium xylanophilum]|uniref:hypothetical protein n=1 Tax=Eubacterium xylanophilum TaxID=39497 RepID=UPI00047CBDFF|nr:hypothetical protein [Eubacterium xylanophilum]
MNALNELSVKRNYYNEQFVSGDGQIVRKELIHGHRVQGGSFLNMVQIMKEAKEAGQTDDKSAANANPSAVLSLGKAANSSAVGSTVMARDDARNLLSTAEEVAYAISGLRNTNGILTNVVKNFAKAYNNIIVRNGVSSVVSISHNMSWMSGLVEGNKPQLNNIGVSVKENKTLSVNEDKLADADIEDVKELFSEGSDFYSKLRERAMAVENIANNSINNYLNLNIS